jgi:hypothetical protein
MYSVANNHLKSISEAIDQPFCKHFIVALEKAPYFFKNYIKKEINCFNTASTTQQQHFISSIFLTYILN